MAPKPRDLIAKSDGKSGSELMAVATFAKMLAEFFESNDMPVHVVFRLPPPIAGIKLWPYHVAANTTVASRRLPRFTDVVEGSRVIGDDVVRFVLLPGSVEEYDRARELLLANPVLNLGVAVVRVDELSVAEELQLLESAGVSHQLALYLEVRGRAVE